MSANMSVCVLSLMTKCLCICVYHLMIDTEAVVLYNVLTTVGICEKLIWQFLQLELSI